MSYPHLSRAPIIEAVLDIKIEAPTGLSLDALRPFEESVRVGFPTIKTIQTFSANFIGGPGGDPKASASQFATGRIFWNKENTRAVQARLDGFSVNHLKDYENWGVLRSMAEEWWRRYTDCVAPVAVVRCGLRYINRIEITAGRGIEDYLRTRAEISKGLPQSVQEYALRLVIPFSEERGATVAQTIQPHATAHDVVDLIIDIDAHSTKRIDPRSVDLWGALDALRMIKNQCFFESLTEETWRAYQ